MAQRKPPTAPKSSGNRGSTAASGKTGAAAKSPTGRGSAATGRGATAAGRPPGRPPAKKGKSIVNQKQTPWGLIATTAAVVLFAVAVVVVVIATHKSKSGGTITSTGGQAVNKNDPYRQPGLAAAMKISGVTYRVEGQHDHKDGVIKYDSSPPVGGYHSQIWANCNGAIYDHQIANENAVHMLEHGAVWITYDPTKISGSQLTTLKGYVQNQDRLALSPYAGLKSAVSLQAWGYQLFVDKADDPRIAQFIATLKYNPKTTPENASCTDPYWNDAAAKASKPGHPVDNPVS
jgi:Protein of unknown function (DUF3105)